MTPQQQCPIMWGELEPNGACKNCMESDRCSSHPTPSPQDYADKHEAYLQGLRDARLNAEQAATAARGQVLKEAEETIQKRIDGIFKAYEGETNPKCTARPFAMAEGMGEAILMVKSLRTQEREQR